MQEVFQHAVKILAAAVRKVQKDFPEGVPPMPAVTIPDPWTVRQPPPPAALD